MPTNKDINILMKHEQDNVENTMYPVTKASNVLIGDIKKYFSVEDWIKSQEGRNEISDEIFHKLKDVEPGAQKNIPAFSRVRVGDKNIEAGIKKDTLSIVPGDNVNIDLIEDELVISSTGATAEAIGAATEDRAGVMTPEQFKKLLDIEEKANSYIHPKSGINAGQYVAVNVDEFGHVTSGIDKPLPVALGGTGMTSLDEFKDLIIAGGDLNTVDTPIEGSDLAITSGGVFDALQEKADKEHGNHVPDSTGDSNKFLQDGNVWAELPKATVLNPGIVQLASSETEEDDADKVAVSLKLLQSKLDDINDGATTYTTFKSIEDFIGSLSDGDGLGGKLDNLLKESKSYTDAKINDVIGGADGSFDTLKEIEEWIKTHQDVYQGLVESISDSKRYTDIQVEKLINNATTYTNFKAVENWIANFGAHKVDKVEGKGLSTNDFTDELKTQYDAAVEHANSYHAPTDAEKNAIATITRNGKEIVPDKDRNVDIIVPIKTSQLINDSNFINAHPEVIADKDTTTAQEVTSGGTFTVIDSINRDKFNHVISVNTKQLTLPKFLEGDPKYGKLTLSIEDGDEKFPEIFDPAEDKEVRLVFDKYFNLVRDDDKIKVNVDIKEASEDSAGLLTPELLEKLKGIENNANNYNLPIAGKDLGGVKTTSTVEDASEYTPSPIINGIVYHKEYGADRGLSIVDGKFGHKNKLKADTISDSKGDRTLAFGESFEIPVIQYDEYGHIVSTEHTEITLPDTAVAGSTKNTLNETQKAYVLGSVSPKTNTNNPVFDTGVYLGENKGELFAEKFFGQLVGIADKALADDEGNEISSTYAKQTDTMFLCSKNMPESPRYGHMLWAELTD